MKEFSFSESLLKKRVKLFIFTLFITTPFIFLIMLLIGETKSGTLLLACVITFITTTIIFAIEIPLLFRSLRGMKVLIEEDKIIKKFRKGEQSLLWVDISNASLVQNPKGNYTTIKLYGKNKDSIHLAGFNQMDEIFSLISKNIPDTAVLKTKKTMIDYESPVWLLLIVVGTLTILATVRLGGEQIENVFTLVVVAGVLMYLLIAKPLSKTNLRWKKLEFFLILLLLISFFFMLIGILLSVLGY